MELLIAFVIVVLAVLWGVSIYFVKTGRMKAEDWHLKALGLPQGSVRALLAFLLIFLLIFSHMTNTTLPDLPDWAVGILGTIVGFYFGAAMRTPAQTSKTEEGTKPKPQ